MSQCPLRGPCRPLLWPLVRSLSQEVCKGVSCSLFAPRPLLQNEPFWLMPSLRMRQRRRRSQPWARGRRLARQASNKARRRPLPEPMPRIRRAPRSRWRRLWCAPASGSEECPKLHRDGLASYPSVADSEVDTRRRVACQPPQCEKVIWRNLSRLRPACCTGSCTVPWMAACRLLRFEVMQATGPISSLRPRRGRWHKLWWRQWWRRQRRWRQFISMHFIVQRRLACRFRRLQAELLDFASVGRLRRRETCKWTCKMIAVQAPLYQTQWLCSKAVDMQVPLRSTGTLC